MGDVRFRAPYQRIASAADKQRALRDLDDDSVIQALAHASRENDPLLANVLATEALNRMRRARVVAKSIGEGVLGFDESARVSYANPAAETLLGANETALFGRAWSEVTMGAPHDEATCPVTRTLRTGETSQRIEESWGSPQAQRTVERGIYPITLEGRTTGAVVVFRDVSKRKLAADELVASEQRYRALYENVPWGILTMWPDGVICKANSAGLVATGRAFDEVKDRAFAEFLHPDDRETVLTVFARVLAGNIEELSLRVRHKEGHYLRAHALGIPIMGERGVAGAHGVWWPEHDMGAGDRDEARSRELEAFSYAVAHDLRAPLRGVVTLTDLLLSDHAGSLDGEGRAILGQMVRGCDRMSRLIEDLLSLSRSGFVELKFAVVDVSALARGVLDGLAAREPSRVMETLVQPGITVEGDPGLLRVALENLLGNAWKFTRRAAQPRIEMTAEEVPEGIVLHVRDNGAGFDPSQAHDLFQPFRRLHSGAEFEGSGIGLATVKRVVERHGGIVWADARPEDGATFHVRLPRGSLAAHRVT